MKISTLIKCLTVLLIILPIHFVHAEEMTISAFPSTVYYFAHLSGPGAPYNDVTFHITAIDEYELYVNGNRIDDEQNDGNWHTVEDYTFTVDSSELVIAVEVRNHGIGDGNGLMIDIEAGADRFGTGTSKRMAVEHDGALHTYPSAWYYAGWDITGSFEYVTKDSWYKLGYDPETGTSAFTTGFPVPEDPDIDTLYYYKILPHVVPGSFNGSMDFTPSDKTEIVTGYPDDWNPIDTGSTENGGLLLRHLEGENIARGFTRSKPAEIPEANDGDISDTYYEYTADPSGATMWIDLENIHRINKMTIFTGGSDPEKWKNSSLKGWAMEISLDNFRWEDVGNIRDVGVSNSLDGGYNYSTVKSPPERARYVRYKIIETRDTLPAVGEIMVFGEGYATKGEYESEWVEFDEPVTLNEIMWDGIVPLGTEIEIQKKVNQLKDDGSIHESEWVDHSAEILYSAVTGVKYRVILSSEDTYLTPVLHSLTITYNTTVSDVDAALPESTALFDAYPNPFNTNTTLSFRVGTASSPQRVQVNVYSMNGQRVRKLKNEMHETGIYQVVWDGRDDSGQTLSSGMYFFRMTADNVRYTKKMILIK
ncbi:FlgD immunoglobulin-like domain containing protein [Candidatus Latescibacterota bacterium]